MTEDGCLTERQDVPKTVSPAEHPAPASTPETAPREEIGGPKGPEPTRFGDWERKGRCIDF